MGMIMVSSIAVATMITNHLLLPIVGWLRWLRFVRRHLLKCRWLAVSLFIGIGYLSGNQVGQPYMLVNIGIISFAAVLQFAPAILGGLFWRRGNKRGAQMGLIAGFIVWTYTLILPAFAKSGLFSAAILHYGPWGIGLLNPEKLFGINLVDPVTHTVFWSMFVNVGLYIVGSLYFVQTETEQRRAEEFVGIFGSKTRYVPTLKSDPHIHVHEKQQIVAGLFSLYFKSSKAIELMQQCMSAAGLDERKRMSIGELMELRAQVEKVLGGSMGAAEAHSALKEHSLFTPNEARELSEYYAEVLADLRVSPEELKRRIDYYKEREMLLERHASELEEKVLERTRDLEQAQHELVKKEKLSVEAVCAGAAHGVCEP
jgi:hypothetical protein